MKAVGILYGPDLLLVGAFIYLAFHGRIRIATPVGKRVLLLGSLWLASQCATDIVRHTAFADYARGWSNIGMTVVNFAVLWTVLYGRPWRLELFGWGLVVGDLLSVSINAGGFVSGYPWKFGFSYPVTLGVFLLVSHEKLRSRWPITMVAMIGIINIVLGSRNLGGVCVAAAVYLLVTRFLRRKGTTGSRLKAGAIVALAASILVGAAGILWAYQYAANSGILGEEARQKYEEQSSGKYGVLLGGRTELLASLPAVYDSPILGHGSWAKDWTYLALERRALFVLGYKGAWDVSREELLEGLIPAHSYLLQAWVYGGVVGAIFWGWLYVLTARALMRVYPPTVVLLPVAAFMAFSLLWDILFSPYGATARFVVPYYIVMLATCMDMAPQKAAQVATAVVKKRTVMAKRRVHAALAPRPQQ